VSTTSYKLYNGVCTYMYVNEKDIQTDRQTETERQREAEKVREKTQMKSNRAYQQAKVNTNIHQ